MKILITGKETPITPAHIDTSRHFFEAFDKSERETSASACVQLAQKNGDWRPFTKAEIDAFYGEDVWFNQLDTMGYPGAQGWTLLFHSGIRR